MGSGLRFLVMDDDMMKMLPKNLESRISWDEVQNEFGSTEIIFIAFGRKDSSVYNQHTLYNLWLLSENLESLEVVKKVTNIRQITKPNLQTGPAHIGVIRKINTNIIFNLLSIILNQLLFPSTYCPRGNLVRIFINLSE